MRKLLDLFLQILVTRGEWSVDRKLEWKRFASGKKKTGRISLEILVNNLSDLLLGCGIVLVLMSLAAFVFAVSKYDFDFFALGVLLAGLLLSAPVVYFGAKAGLRHELDFDRKAVCAIERAFFDGPETIVANFSDIIRVELDARVDQHIFGTRQVFFIVLVRGSLSKIVVSNLVENPDPELIEQAQGMAQLLGIPYNLSVNLRDKIAEAEARIKDAKKLW
ncbi:MAG: hypothetical protein CVV41_18610 [Candidatus Riflebacteria bacterium HGW-Riflebacteria-1]|jgi:hypothetical protein|nr:MAG: hypothetical protein CVV41_18610 [Candidatus Riflebacteria bacterium HGW-Riflebacteria-1]